MPLLIALIAALGCAGWVLYVVAPSAGHPPARPAGYLVLGILGVLAIGLVAAGLAGGGLTGALAPLPLAAVVGGLVIAVLLPLARPRVLLMTGGPAPLWALARAWRALQPVRRAAQPAPGDAAWARAILREAEELRTPRTAEFIDLLQGSLRTKLGGEPGVDPGWLEAHLEEAATRLFPDWRTWAETDRNAALTVAPSDPPDPPASA